MVPKRLHGGVEFVGHHRHLRLLQAGDAECFDQLVHPPRRHPEQIAGGHHSGQRPLGALAALSAAFAVPGSAQRVGLRTDQGYGYVDNSSRSMFGMGSGESLGQHRRPAIS
jgi:hypothetical protein